MKRFTLRLIAAMLFASPLSAAALRPDLNRQSAYFCRYSPKTLDDQIVIDVGLELAFIGGVSSPEDMARDFAKGNRHRGYAFGSCRDGRQWILSSLAPKEPVIRSKTSWDVQESVLSACARYDVDAIMKSDAKPIALVKGAIPQSSGQRSIALSDRFASLSLTCFPRDKGHSGPELWAFQLFAPAPIKGVTDWPSMLGWINGERQKLGLPLLQLEERKLRGLAEKSAVNQSIVHPHSLLLQEKSQLKRAGIELIGEDRAMADDFSGLLTLLWNSPQHRRLLLHEKANAVGYSLTVAKATKQKHLVLVLAKI